MREAELTDKILSMKGYREFGPVWEKQEIEIPLDPEWEEHSLLEEEGFRPY